MLLMTSETSTAVHLSLKVTSKDVFESARGRDLLGGHQRELHPLTQRVR